MPKSRYGPDRRPPICMAIPQSTASAHKPNGRHRRHRRHVWKDKHYRWVPTATATGGSRATSSATSTSRSKNHYRGPGKKPTRAARSAAAAPVSSNPRPAGAYQGPFGPRPGGAAAATAPASAPIPGQAEQLASLGLVGAVQSLTRPSGAADPAPARRRSTTTATRSPPPTPGATTTSGGSTAWSAPTSRWSSGWRSSSTTGSRPRNAERLQHAADDRPVEPLPRRLLRLLPRPLQGGDGRPGDAAVAERRRKHARRRRTRTTAAR